MFFTIKKFGQVFALAVVVALFVGCVGNNGVSSITSVDQPQNVGQLKANIILGQEASLKKTTAYMVPYRIIIRWNKAGYGGSNVGADTIPISQTSNAQTVSTTISLESMDYNIDVQSWDSAGNIIHSSGQQTITIQAGKTTVMTLSIQANYTIFLGKIYVLPDSATKTEFFAQLVTNGSPSSCTAADSFAKGSKDTSLIKQGLFLDNRPSATNYSVRLRIYGDNGPSQKGIVLYQADTTVSLLPGVDQSATILMKQIAGFPTAGAVQANVGLGKVAMYTMNSIVQ